MGKSSVWNAVSLVPERLNDFLSYSIFESLSIMDRSLMNASILALKVVDLHMPLPPPKEQRKEL
jgi:hypothetical protein